jgi:hypothetical protein
VCRAAGDTARDHPADRNRLAFGRRVGGQQRSVGAGIDSDAPGFSKVKIEPHLGTLTNASGTIPHANGNIKASYILQNDKWNVDIILPQTITGRFIWKGKTYPLKPGTNNFNL